MVKKYGSALLGIAISAGFLFLALRRVSLAQVAEAMARVKLLWLGPMIGVVAADLFVRSWRWRFLLSAREDKEGPIPLAMLIKLEAIGLAMNNVLFMRLGEFARAYLAGLELGVSGVYALATVFVERALDIMSLLSLFVAAAGYCPDIIPSSWRVAAALVVAGLAAGLVVVSAVDRSLEKGGVWEAWLSRTPRGLGELVRKLALGSRALRSWRVAVPAAMLSLSLWLIDAVIYWFAWRAMGLAPDLGYGRAVVVLSTAAAASALPTAPGAFGTFEQFVKTLLVSWQVPAPQALAYAGIVHLLSYLTVTLLGIVFLYQMGHSFGSLGRAARGEPA